MRALKCCCFIFIFTGYYGTNCTDACSLNPCEHESTCTRKLSSSRGYTCDCPRNFFGLYCEKKYSFPHLCRTLCVLIVIVVLCATLGSIIQSNVCVNRTGLPCPRGRWGHKTCGPCNCQTDKGFDFDCNKTSGECRCKVTAAAFNSLLYNTLTTYCRPYTNVIFQCRVLLHRIIAYRNN